MILFGVMSLVEDQEIDLADLEESIEQRLVEDLSRAHNDHVLRKLVIPDSLVPEIGPHGPEDMCHALIKVISKNRRLLKDESHAVNLDCVSIYLRRGPNMGVPRRMPHGALSHLHDGSVRTAGCASGGVRQSGFFLSLASLLV